MRRLAIEREKQRRYKAAMDSCPLSREEYEGLMQYVSDHIVEHGHSHDWSLTIAYLESRHQPTESVIRFLMDWKITDDWSLFVDGDSCNVFGPTKCRAARMPLEEEDLHELLEWLDIHIQEQGCGHTHRLTRLWLSQHEKPETQCVGALMALGGFCDCEVAMNVEPDEIYPKHHSEQGASADAKNRRA